MQYIEKIDDVWQLKKYYNDYLPTVWEKFSSGAKNLIKDGRNGLQSPESWHDALIKGINLETVYDENDVRNDIKLDVELASGKKLNVVYRDVSYFRFNKEISMVPIPPVSVHELTVDEDGDYIHEIALVSSEVWRINFCDVELIEFSK